MNEMISLIKQRRSCRSYLDKKIPPDIVLELIDAARHAPFGGKPNPNCQV